MCCGVESLRGATTNTEWSHGTCQRRAQSHAATVPPSTGTRCHSSRSLKAQTVSLASFNTTFRVLTYISWCCIDLLRPPRLPGRLPGLGRLCTGVESSAPCATEMFRTSTNLHHSAGVYRGFHHIKVMRCKACASEMVTVKGTVVSRRSLAKQRHAARSQRSPSSVGRRSGEVLPAAVPPKFVTAKALSMCNWLGFSGSVQPAEIRIFMHLEGDSETVSWTKVPSGFNSNRFAPST
jgi:hypothetical protein